MSKRAERSGYLSIGALAAATGVPADTLRTWERRYGFPEPLRRPSGHRRYALAIVDRLRLVRQALALGHRASEVVPLEVPALRELLVVHGEGAQTVTALRQSRASDALTGIAGWLDATSALGSEALVDAMREDWSVLGPLGFVEQRALPFLREVGERWRRGELGIAHEHFASHHLRTFLDRRRPTSAASADHETVVCATLPGEQHEIALHLAAVVLGLEGAGLIFLGADTPLADLIAAARQSDASAVVIGSSFAADSAAVIRDLAALRRALDPQVAVVVGGGDERVEVPGVVRVSTLAGLRAWYHRWAGRAETRTRALAEDA